MVDYLTVGTELSASHMNDLYEALDDKLTAALNGQSIVLFGEGHYTGVFNLPDWRYARRFYFTSRDFLTNPSSSLANSYMAKHITAGAVDPYTRVYEHQPFVDAVDNAQLYDPIDGDCRPVSSSEYPVAIFDGPFDDADQFGDAFMAAVWPDTGLTGFDADKHSLKYSLQAHTKPVTFETGSVDCYLYINGADEPEHILVWDACDIIIGDGDANGLAESSSMDWPDEYDKYRFFRFTNLRSHDFTIHFSNGLSVVIPPCGSRCVRRVGDEYIEGYNHFHIYMPGDPWCLNPIGNAAADFVINYHQARYDNNNITDCLVGAQTMVNAGPSVLDLTKAQDLTSMYCNPSKTANPFEFPMPDDGWYCDPSDLSKPIGDLCIQRGDLLVVDPAGPFLVHRNQTMTVDNSLDKHLLRKKDGTIALGQQSASFIIFSGSTNIPHINGGGFTNWVTGSDFDGSGNIIDNYVQFILPGVAGHDLQIGNIVTASYWHKTDDGKWFVSFDGMDSVAAMVNEASMSFTRNADSTSTISSRPGGDRDLINFSTNFLVAMGGAQNAVRISNIPFNVHSFTLPVFFKDFVTPNEFSTLQTTEQNDYWYEWTFDGSSYTATHPGHTASFDESYVTSSQSEHIGSQVFDFFDPLLKLKDYIEDQGGPVANTDVTFGFNSFGPSIAISQSVASDYPITADFNYREYFEFDADTNTWIRIEANPLRYEFGTGYRTSDGAVNPWWEQIIGSADLYQWPKIGLYRAHEVNYPRFNRRWQSHRYFDINPHTMPFANTDTCVGGTSTEEPMFKSYYESKPFWTHDDNQTDTLKTIPSTKSKTLNAFVYPFTKDADIYTRLAAWVSKEKITYTSNAAGATTTQDYTVGSSLQSAYYSANRSNILAGTTTADDAVVRNVKPISIQDFNSVASICNSCVGTPFFAPDAIWTDYVTLFLGELGIEKGPGHGIIEEIYSGLSAPANAFIRPREMAFMWDAEIYPDTEAVIAGFGVDVLTIDDYPDNIFDTLHHTSASWYKQSTGTITVEPHLDFGITSSYNILDVWTAYNYDGIEAHYVGGISTYRTGSLENHRWVTIESAKTIAETMGIPAALLCPTEIVVPCNFLLKDADISILDTDSGDFSGPEYFTSNAFGFFTEETGSYVRDVDTGDFSGAALPIRMDTSPVDNCCILMGFGSVKLVAFDYGALKDRFYPDRQLALTGQSFSEGGFMKNALIHADSVYLVRIFGESSTSERGTAIIYPRSYNDYQSRNVTFDITRYNARGTLGNGVLPRSAVDDLDGTTPSYITLTDEETVISADDYEIENGILTVVPHFKTY